MLCAVDNVEISGGQSVRTVEVRAGANKQGILGKDETEESVSYNITK